MPNTFYMADPHFGHENIINFKRSDGKPLRPFATVEEMDETMVKNWNETVRPQDTTYIAGDVVINRKALPILDRLNGRKVLIKGNHDIFKLKDYVKYFDDIRAYKIMPAHGIICSHIPIHPESLARWRVNVHGHLHSNRVQKYENYYTDVSIDDEKYMCVSVEQINYTPISLDEILSSINK